MNGLELNDGSGVLDRDRAESRNSPEMYGLSWLRAAASSLMIYVFEGIALPFGCAL